MKVLHLIDSGGLYGAEKMLLILVAEQIKRGLDPLILSVGPGGEPEKAIEIEARRLNIPVKSWPMRPGLNLKETWQILKWARAQGFEIAHSHGYKFNILLGFFPRFLRKLYFISTLHGYTATRMLSKLGLYQKLDLLALRNADALVLVASSMQAFFKNWRSVRVIPNGLPSEPGNLCAPPVSKDEYLVAVGRLSEEKAFARLLTAYASVVRSRSDFRMDLVIAGEGPQRRALENLASQLEVASRVHFLGFVEDAAALIVKAQALAISSDTEGLPLVLLEAMRAETPVISTPVGEVPKVLGFGEHGYLSEDLSTPSFARALAEFLEDRKRALEKAASAKQQFDRFYTSDAMADAYLSVYQELKPSK